MFYEFINLLIMKPEFYLPILKSKEGEFIALSKLDTFSRKHICPLFEVSKLEYDSESKKKHKTIEEHLYSFCEKKFIKRWFSENSFIDTILLDGQQANGVTCLEYIFQQIVDTVLMPVVPMPVAHLNDSLQFRTGMIKVIKTYRVSEIGVRIQIEDAMDIHLAEKLDNLLRDLGISYQNSHMIFDLANSDYAEYESFAEGIISLLESFPQLENWKSFTICGGAFPRSDLLKKGENKIVRLDWKLFKLVERGIRQSENSRKINYGDYSIVSPGQFEFDPKKMKRSANIRYTFGEYWLVLKGSALSKPKDFEQYFTQAGEICESAHYLGDSYSQGDTHIKLCQLRKVTAGSPTIWNWVGNNHHFTKVIADLFANPVGS